MTKLIRSRNSRQPLVPVPAVSHLIGTAICLVRLVLLVMLRLAICAVDSSGLPSAPWNIAIIGTGAAAGGWFTLENITWPAVAGLVSYVLFVATQDDLICAQATGALTAGPNNTYTPGSITFGGPLVRSTWALPSPYVSKVRLKAKHLIHGGIIGAPVDSVSTGALVVGYLKGSPPSSNPSFTPVGRIISIIGRPESATPYFSATITSWDSSTGTIGVTPDPNGIVQAGDCLVVRYNADASNSANPTSITDSGCQNIAYPAGMTPGAEVGNLVRVIRGVSRGTPPRKITANTATTSLGISPWSSTPATYGSSRSRRTGGPASSPAQSRRSPIRQNAVDADGFAIAPGDQLPERAGDLSERQIGGDPKRNNLALKDKPQTILFGVVELGELYRDGASKPER